MGRKRSPRPAFTLLEVLVSMSVFVIIMLAAANALNQSSRVLMSSNGRDTVLKQFYRARRLLVADLELTHLSATTFQQTRVGPNQGPGYDGDAICFLSPVDPTTQQVVYGAESSVFWMRNISYFCMVPSNHNQIANHICAGVADSTGYDDGCPHKMLVRQVTDNNNSNPNVPTSIQTLLSPFGPLAQINGYPNTASIQTLAVNLLSFRVTQPNTGGEVSIDLRAVSLPDATRDMAIGSVPLTPTSYLIEQTFSVFPKN